MSLLGLYDRCGAVFEHLATASTEFDDTRRLPSSQTQSQPLQPAVAADKRSSVISAVAADKKSSVLSSMLNARPKTARLHTAHALSMDMLLSMAVEMGMHTQACWKHIFRFVLPVEERNIVISMSCLSVCLSVCLLCCQYESRAL